MDMSKQQNHFQDFRLGIKPHLSIPGFIGKAVLVFGLLSCAGMGSLDANPALAQVIQQAANEDSVPSETPIENASEGIVDSAVENQPLTIQQAIEMAIANDPVFQQIHWQIEEAKGNRLQQTRLPNPSAGIVSNEIGNEGSAGQYGVFWSQNIVRNNRQAIQHQFFSIDVAAAQFRYDARRWNLTQTIAKYFLEIHRLQQQRQATEEQLQNVGKILKITKDLFAAGEISEIDSSNIELEMASLRQRLVEIGVGIEYQRRALAIPLNLTNDSLTPQTDFDWSNMVSALLQKSDLQIDDNWIENHPQLNIARALTQQSQTQIALARAGRCPDLQVQGSLNYDAASEDLFAGFQIGMPILKYDNKSGAIHAATAAYSRRMEAERLVRMKLRSNYTVRAGQLARFQSRVTNIRDVIIPRAEQNLDQIQSAYEAGEAEFVLLKSGFERVIQAQIDLIDAEYEMALAETQLQTLLVEQ